MVLDGCTEPIVLAPLAGGPSTPELTAAVSNAGGLGFLAAGYLPPGDLRRRLVATRALTDRPFGVNLFVPGPPAAPGAVDAYAAEVADDAASVGAAPGDPRYDDDAYDAKLALLLQDPPAVVSFTFGLPAAGPVARLRAAGSEIWVTVTSVAEASAAVDAGADLLVVQGAEAGGHRGGWDDDPAGAVALLPLLQLVRAHTDRPMVAAGGIATGAAIAAVLACGARAAALGTAFLDTPEAGTAAVHRGALRAGRPTAFTRAFTGRSARGITNEFLERHSPHAPRAYPEVHHVTAPLRQAARAAGRAELVNLWAGQAHPLARSEPAGDVVRSLGAQTRSALAAAASVLGAGRSAAQPAG